MRKTINALLGRYSDLIVEKHYMELEFIKLIDWFKLYGGGGRLIDASSLPSDMDLDLTDRDGREVELARILKKITMPRQRSYYLGSVTTGVFGMQSSANHRIV